MKSKTNNEDYSAFNGILADPNWALPKKVADSKDEARPGYTTYLANEYLDSDEVLKAKIKVLANLIKQSKNFVVYTGAGISMSSGINDYATKSKNSVTKKGSETINRLKALPSLSHYALVELYKAKYLKHWIQQNHDGLAQKAGYPQKDLNEIHGSWFDKKNQVVLMDDKLKPENHKLLLEWEDKCDLCLSLGTSMSGMNSDRVASTAGARALKGEGFGLVIINLQKTQYDEYSSVRIFSTLDKAMPLLLSELELKLPKTLPLYDNPMLW